MKHPRAKTLVDHREPLDFVQAVRFLTSLHPQAPRPGSRESFAQERLRFQHNPALCFGTAELANIETGAEGSFKIQGNFLGISGESSPVPQYMVEPLATPGEEQNPARDYLDIFHHRLYALLFRGLDELDIAAQTSANAKNSWTSRLICLLGIDLPGSSQLEALSPLDLLRLCPLLSCHAKSRRAIEQGINVLLAPFLRSPDSGAHATASLHDFEGDWTPIDAQAQLKLGRANHRLGQYSLLGKRVKHRASKARIEVGPLHHSQQHHFEPRGLGYRRLAELLALCVQTPIDFTLDLRIRYQSLDHCTLGRSRLRVDSVLPGSQRHCLRQITRPLTLPWYSTPPAPGDAAPQEPATPRADFR